MADELEVTPRVEKLVWAGIGRKSARQIAEETGISPEQVLAIKRTLLEQVDVLTIQEKRQKLLVDLQDIAQRAQDDYDNAPMEFKAGIMNSATAAIKAVLVELNRADKADQSKVDALNSLRVKELYNLMVEVVDDSVTEIAKKYDIDADDLFAIFNSRMTKAAAKRELQ